MKLFNNILIASSLLLALNVAHADNSYKNTLVFNNCTGKEITVTNDVSPYKFSLDANSPAENGTSPTVTFTIPTGKSTHEMTTFFKSFAYSPEDYTDGAMHVVLTGGINGSIMFLQDVILRHTAPSEYVVSVKIDENNKAPKKFVFYAMNGNININLGC